MNDKQQNITDDVIDPELREKLKELVLQRVNAMPDTLCISVGSADELTKKDLAKHVQDGDEVGEQIIAMQLEFLRDLASGVVYGNE